MPKCLECPHCLTPNAEIIAARLNNTELTFSCAKGHYKSSEGKKYPFRIMHKYTDHVQTHKDCPI